MGVVSDRKLRDYFPLEFVGLRAAAADGAGNAKGSELQENGLMWICFISCFVQQLQFTDLHSVKFLFLLSLLLLLPLILTR